METKRFSVNKDTLFEGRNEQYALVYDDTHYHNHSAFDERGNWEYINEKHIYIVFCEKTPSFTVGMNRNVFRNKNNYFF